MLCKNNDRITFYKENLPAPKCKSFSPSVEYAMLGEIVFP